jgi:hypothetical protein
VPDSDLQPIDLSPGPTWNTDAERNPELYIQPTDSDVFNAAASNAMASGPTATLGRMWDRTGYSTAPTINGADATTQFGVKGPTPDLSLSWEPGEQVRPDVALQQQQLMKQRINNQWIMANRPSTWGGAISSFGGDLLGTGADPLNIAASFVPVSWLGRGAELALDAARMGGAADQAALLAKSIENSVARRITASAVQNATGVALTQPILLAGAQQDHTDYTFTTAAGNVLFGGLLGAGLHGVGELLTSDVARGMMRAGAKSADDGSGIAPELASDFVNASRPQVAQDLQDQLGRVPTEDEVQTEMGTRQDAITQKQMDGGYAKVLPQVGDVEPPVDSDALAVNDQVNTALQNDDYAGAAKAMKQHTDALESDPDIPLTDEEKQAANEPIDNFNQTKSLLDDFVGCVSSP